MREDIIEILVEEPSMQNVLKILLPKILPEGYALDVNCFIRPHQGKSDLQKSLRNKVKAYPHFPQPVKLIVVHDQDSNDCIVLKQKLIEIIQENNQEQPYLIRIACRELENWYLGICLQLKQFILLLRLQNIRIKLITEIQTMYLVLMNFND